MIDITVVGVDHLQDGLIADTLYTGNGLGVSAWTAASAATEPNSSPMGLFKKGRSLCYGPLAAPYTVKRGLAGIQFAPFMGGRNDIQSIVVGLRVKGPINAATAGRRAFGCSSQAPAAVSTPETILVSYTNQVLVPGYYEFEFLAYQGDGNAPDVRVYLDGSLIRTTPNLGSGNLWTPANIIGRWFLIGDGSGNMLNTTVDGQGGTAGDVQIEMEDIYVAYSTVKGVSARQGPVVIRALPVATIGAAPWTSSDEGLTPVEVLNLPNHHASVLEPLVSSDNGNSAAKLKFNTSALQASDTVLAITGAVSVRRETGVASNLSTKWSTSGSDSAVGNFTPTNGVWTLMKDVALPNLLSVPGGGVLTKASIAQIEMVLTPNQ